MPFRFFRLFKFRMMARQLRKPRGFTGNKVGLMMNKANEFLYDQTLAILSPQHTEKILEIGFGNGRFFNKIHETAPGAILLGADFSPTMFQEAAAFNKSLIEKGILRLHKTSSDQLPFEDGSIDKVFCINVIYFWDLPQDHLVEIKRILKPGGRFLATIRTKESMELMPFTRFGFRKYDLTGWEAELRASGLQLETAVKIQEPSVEFDGDRFTIESICLVALKR